MNIKTSNLNSAIYDFVSAWKDVKMTTPSNSWKKIMLEEDSDLDIAGPMRNDFHKTLLRDGEKEDSVEDVENRLEENDSEPGYQVLSTEEITTRYWLMSNQERVAAVTQRTRWW